MNKVDCKYDIASPYLKEIGKEKIIELIDPTGVDYSETKLVVNNVVIPKELNIVIIDGCLYFDGIEEKEFSIGYQVIEDDIKEIKGYLIRNIKKIKLCYIYTISNREYKHNRQQSKKAKTILKKIQLERMDKE